jgi:hypothetical protein
VRSFGKKGFRSGTFQLFFSPGLGWAYTKSFWEIWAQKKAFC